MLELYHHGSSVCAAKVRLYLEEKHLAWEGHYIDILKGEQFTPEYRKINPKSVVPTLVHDGTDDPGVLGDLRVSRRRVRGLGRIRPEDPVRCAPRCATGPRRSTRSCTRPAARSPSCPPTATRFGRSARNECGNSSIRHRPFRCPPTGTERKKTYVRLGFEAPDARAKVELYDRYLHRMEEGLREGDWLVGDGFSFADIAMTPYVMRLDMLSMQGMWSGGRLPGVEAWLGNGSRRGRASNPRSGTGCPTDLTGAAPGRTAPGAGPTWPPSSTSMRREPP